MSDERKIKVIIAKPGLDGHDRGAKVVARALRDAGGLSIPSGAHLELFPRVVEELQKRGMDDVVLFGGGIIPHEDIPQLEKLGVKGIFGPGASKLGIVEGVRKNAPARGAASRS